MAGKINVLGFHDQVMLTYIYTHTHCLPTAICRRGSFLAELLPRSYAIFIPVHGRWCAAIGNYKTVCGRGLNAGEHKEESKAKTNMIIIIILITKYCDTG